MKQDYWRRILLVMGLCITLAGCAQKEVQKLEEPVLQEEAVEQVVEVKGEIEEVRNPKFEAVGIRKVLVASGNEEKYSISYEPKPHENSYEYWKMAIPYQNKAIVDTEKMLEIYEWIADLDMESGGALETEMSAETGSIYLEFCQLTEDETSSYEEKANGKCTILIGEEDGEGNYYVALSTDTNYVYKIDKTIIDRILEADPFTMILKVGTIIPINTVSSINITIGEKSYNMGVENEEYYFDKKVSKEEYQTLYSKLLSIFIEREYLGEVVEKEALLSLEFIRKSEGGEGAIIKYYTYDEEYAILSQDGVENYMVNKSDVEELINTIKEKY